MEPSGRDEEDVGGLESDLLPAPCIELSLRQRLLRCQVRTMPDGMQP